MKLTILSTCKILHNEDYSGEVIIRTYNPQAIPEHHEVTIFFSDLKEIVSDYIKQAMMNKLQLELQGMSSDQILIP